MTTDHQTGMPTPADRRAIEMIYRAFGSADPDLLDQALAPDWQDYPLAPGQGPGPDGLKPIIHAFAAAFADLRITIDEMIGVPGRVAVRGWITGIHRGPWFGIAPTGRQIEVAIHEFHHLKDGRITHTWHLEDWFGLLNQLGAWPPATETAVREAAR